MLEHKIFFISGGYFYYSVLPQLGETLYTLGLAVGRATWAKLLSWVFGLLATYVTYNLARKYASPKWSLVAAVVFYSNLVVGWLSITAYVELLRTFFEVLAVYLLVDKKIYSAAIVLGLAITTKLFALGTLPIFLVLLLVSKYHWKQLGKFTLLALLVPLPWFIMAYTSTHNPIYPVFSNYNLSSVRSIWDGVTIWFRSPDPLSPVYAITFPLIVIFRRKLPLELLIYCILALAVWWVLPHTGGGRFILPYLPVFSVLATLAISHLKDKYLQKILLGIVVGISLLSAGLRAVANYKYLPVILGYQSTADFLQHHLSTKFGNNFYYLSDDELKSLYK